MNSNKVHSVQSSKGYLSVLAVFVCLLAGMCSAKSVRSTNSDTCVTPLQLSNLYPNTNTVALLPTGQTPFNDGTVHPVPPCPVSTPVSSYTSENLKGTCPFDYVNNYNRHRIPAVIPEARCLCGGCLDPYTGQQAQGQQAQDRDCLEIKYPVKVLQRSTTAAIGGFDVYTLAEEDITVGCTCSRV